MITEAYLVFEYFLASDALVGHRGCYEGGHHDHTITYRSKKTNVSD